MSARKRVLIIDDNPAIGTMCRHILEAGGQFIVGMVECGLHALASAREFVPDLILLDYHLPGRNGVEIAGDLDGDEVLRTVPVALMTGDAGAPSGRLPVIAKPFDGHQLLRFADAMLEA
jgi:CheY-like chemotaxis protein